ncbi:MAG: hypothetical protein AABX59_03015 [Nanoarchaeota archaeon]
MFDTKEIGQLALALLLMAFLISFTKLTVLSYLIALVMVVIILIPHVLAHKIVALKYEAHSRFQLLEWKRFWVFESAEFKHPFPIWLVLPALVVFLTQGAVKIFTIESFKLETKETRLGRKWTTIMESENAFVAMAGPIVNLVIAFLALLLVPYFEIMKEFALLNLWFAFFSVIPLFNLDGIKIFFGGKIQWVFIFIITLAMIVLARITNLWVTLIVALLLALLVAVWLLFSETFQPALRRETLHIVRP